MDILHFAVFLFLLYAVTSKKCYYEQEPDQSGKLRWVTPSTQKEHCSCTAILPGGVNSMAPLRPYKPYYTDQPLFTDDVELIYDYFDCRAESNPTIIKTRVYTDCQAWFDAGSTDSGVYNISAPSDIGREEVYCDMEDGKGWLVFQRRQDGSISFTRPWKEYQEGFGDFTSEFWLGNEVIRLLTDAQAGTNWTIRVDLTDEYGQLMSLMTSPFRITGDKYTISIGRPGIQPIVDGVCGQKLGMEDGTIPDTSIKASSVYRDDADPCITGKGRLNHAGGGGWCPQKDDVDASWFQVDLSKPTQVEGVIMQGSLYKHRLALYADWVRKYKVEYSNDQNSWHYVGRTSVDTAQVFNGCTDADTPVTSMFNYSIEARYFRIRPIVYHHHPSMRIELIGCKDNDRGCGQRLGMEDGTIPDTSITASSVYTDDLSFGVWSDYCNVGKGRLNHAGGGGWCPQKDDVDAPWFQVNLSKTTQVEGIIMQGSKYLTYFADWVTKYKVEYSRDQGPWHYVGGTSLDTAQIFDGNTNSDSPVTSMFDEPIQARYIRIRPIEYHRHPSMRIELVGCRGDIIELLNGRHFSTHDSDNDNDVPRNCADISKAGWWFDSCEVESSLNGEYSRRVSDSDHECRGIRWSGRQIVKSEMKIRRSN